MANVLFKLLKQFVEIIFQNVNKIFSKKKYKFLLNFEQNYIYLWKKHWYLFKELVCGFRFIKFTEHLPCPQCTRTFLKMISDQIKMVNKRF